MGYVTGDGEGLFSLAHRVRQGLVTNRLKSCDHLPGIFFTAILAQLELTLQVINLDVKSDDDR